MPETRLRATPTVEAGSNLDADKKVFETAYFESKFDVISQLFCAEYDKLDNTEKRVIWSTYIKRATLEIIEKGRT